MRRARLVLAGSALVFLVACNAIIGLSGDYDVVPADASAPDGYVAPTADAKPSADVETPPDAGIEDVFIPDAPYDALYPTAWDRDASARDASAIEAGFLDAGVTKYCDGISDWFCWDFTGDAGIRVGPTFWTSEATTGGTIAMIGDPSAPSHAAEAVLVYRGEGTDVYLDWNWASPSYNELELSFSFGVVQAGATARLVTLDAFGAEYGLGVYGGASCYGAPCLGEVGPEDPNVDTATPFDVNVWYRADIDIKRDATTHDWSAVITVGGHVVAKRSTGAFPQTPADSQPLDLKIGAFEAVGADGTTILDIDDILLQLR